MEEPGSLSRDSVFARRPAAAGFEDWLWLTDPHANGAVMVSPWEAGEEMEVGGRSGCLRGAGRQGRGILAGGWFGSPRGQHPGIGGKKGQAATTPRTTHAANSSGALRPSGRARWQGGGIVPCLTRGRASFATRRGARGVPLAARGPGASGPEARGVVRGVAFARPSAGAGAPTPAATGDALRPRKSSAAVARAISQPLGAGLLRPADGPQDTPSDD
jgi:hypothetical protein